MTAGSRSPKGNGSTTSDSDREIWPSTSSSPGTRIGPPGSPRASNSIELEHRHREFASATGTFRGQRVSVVSTGIGTDNVEIAVAEILAITTRPTFIRVGSCGALQPGMHLGDLVITTGGVRLETTTSWYRARWVSRGRRS